MIYLKTTNLTRVLLLLTTSVLIVLLCSSFTSTQRALAASASQDGTQPISSRLAFLRAQRAAAAARNQPQQQQLPTPKTNDTQTPTSSTTTASPLIKASNEASKPVQSSTVNSSPDNAKIAQAVNQASVAAVSNNRTTRTADVFQNGDGFNIFVTNTCERELMHVNIKTSRPFFGVMHTRNQRQKPGCTIEGNGETEYNLDISHVLNQQDPAYCGVIRARKESPDEKDLLSVVLAVRVHRNIELSDDKFFLLNCTNRCRRPDCSPALSRLTDARDGSNARVINDDLAAEREGGERETATIGGARRSGNDKKDDDECTIWKFPWLITLLWCMGILLLAMIISHCIMCSSLICRCVKTEVEEREPSIYEGASDLEDEDSLYNRKTHPMRIDYDNKDIYKTSNNYEPYRLENDEDCRDDDAARRRSYSNRKGRGGQ